MKHTGSALVITYATGATVTGTLALGFKRQDRDTGMVIQRLDGCAFRATLEPTLTDLRLWLWVAPDEESIVQVDAGWQLH